MPGQRHGQLGRKKEKEKQVHALTTTSAVQVHALHARRRTKDRSGRANAGAWG